MENANATQDTKEKIVVSKFVLMDAAEKVLVKALSVNVTKAGLD